MPFLPEEILSQIFLLLPAKILHEVMRTVCRTWRKIIRDPDFIKAHLCLSSITPFFHFRAGPRYTLSFPDLDQTTGKFNEMSGGLTSLEIPEVYLTHGAGSLLSSNWKDQSLLYVINPLSKQIVTLPRLPVNVSVNSRLIAVGCSQSTLECKVVYTHEDSEAGTHRTYILTVGVDKEWRAIREEPSTTFKLPFAQGIRGFIYWYSLVASYVIALDVETEVFYKVLFPEECRRQITLHTSSDRFLSFALASYDGWRTALIEVEFWELVDCKFGGEWRKLGRIDLESKRRELNEMGLQCDQPCPRMATYPVTVLNNRDVAIFRFREPNFMYVAYNFKTGEFFRWLNAPREPSVIGQFQHVNSLVVLKT